MNPYIIIGLIISHIGLFGVGYWKGGEYMKNSIEAEQKKAQDIAIVKHEEVAKNDLTQALKVETAREEKKAVFRGIRERKTDLVGNSNCPVSDDVVRLLNAANRGTFETNSTSQPSNPVPGTTVNK
jgi:hypothetical protein